MSNSRNGMRGEQDEHLSIQHPLQFCHDSFCCRNSLTPQILHIHWVSMQIFSYTSLVSAVHYLHLNVIVASRTHSSTASWYSGFKELCTWRSSSSVLVFVYDALPKVISGPRTATMALARRPKTGRKPDTAFASSDIRSSVSKFKTSCTVQHNVRSLTLRYAERFTGINTALPAYLHHPHYH